MKKIVMPAGFKPMYQSPKAKIAKVRKTNVGGILLELIGFILLFLFPFGTITGILLMALGFSLSKAFICSSCGNPIDGKHVRLCPTCKIDLAP